MQQVVVWAWAWVRATTCATRWSGVRRVCAARGGRRGERGARGYGRANVHFETTLSLRPPQAANHAANSCGALKLARTPREMSPPKKVCMHLGGYLGTFRDEAPFGHFPIYFAPDGRRRYRGNRRACREGLAGGRPRASRRSWPVLEHIQRRHIPRCEPRQCHRRRGAASSPSTSPALLTSRYLSSCLSCTCIRLAARLLGPSDLWPVSRQVRGKGMVLLSVDGIDVTGIGQVGSERCDAHFVVVCTMHYPHTMCISAQLPYAQGAHSCLVCSHCAAARSRPHHQLARRQGAHQGASTQCTLHTVHLPSGCTADSAHRVWHRSAYSSASPTATPTAHRSASRC